MLSCWLHSVQGDCTRSCDAPEDVRRTSFPPLASAELWQENSATPCLLTTCCWDAKPSPTSMVSRTRPVVSHLITDASLAHSSSGSNVSVQINMRWRFRAMVRLSKGESY